MLIELLYDDQKKSIELESFNKDVVSFGRDKECDICIEKQYVSKVHGCFYKENDIWKIQDLDSSNGIYINGNKVYNSILNEETQISLKTTSTSVDKVEIFINRSGIDKNEVIKDESKMKNLREKRKRKGSSDNTGSLIGIIFTIMTILILIATIVMIVVIKNKKNDSDMRVTDDSTDVTESDTYTLSDEIEESVDYIDDNEAFDVSELDLSEFDIGNAEEYFKSFSKIINVTEAIDSTDILTGYEEINELKSRGFDQNEVTIINTLDGQMYEKWVAIRPDEKEKFPEYRTLFTNSNDELWNVIVTNGSIIANPVSYNLVSEKDAQVVVSESNSITCYYYPDNKFYEVVPFESEIIIIPKDKIDADVLNELTVDKIDQLLQ